MGKAADTPALARSSKPTQVAKEYHNTGESLMMIKSVKCNLPMLVLPYEASVYLHICGNIKRSNYNLLSALVTFVA